MGIFKRFGRMVKSNLNDMMSKAEDSEKMLNQLISDMNRELVDTKKNVAAAIADEKKLERQVNNSNTQAKEWEEKARNALNAGREDLAKEALVRKQEQEKIAEEYREQWEAQHESVEKLKRSLRTFQQKIEEAQRKKNLLIARSKRVETQRKLQYTVHKYEESSAFATFDRITQEIEQKESENEAIEDIEEWSDNEKNLEKEFAELEQPKDQTPDLLLEDLKMRMQEEESGKKE
ncbi:MAG: PspA/IM30 family protein [Spirochaetaceae bacterium]